MFRTRDDVPIGHQVAAESSTGPGNSQRQKRALCMASNAVQRNFVHAVEYGNSGAAALSPRATASRAEVGVAIRDPRMKRVSRGADTVPDGIEPVGWPHTAGDDQGGHQV
jgi:hypothetical protein